MPPVEAPQPTQDVQNESDGISKPMVGIIYPPPEVRSILLCNFRKNKIYNTYIHDYTYMMYVLINWYNNNDDNYNVINFLNQINSETIPNPSVEDMACVSLWAILELKKNPNCPDQ